MVVIEHFLSIIHIFKYALIGAVHNLYHLYQSVNIMGQYANCHVKYPSATVSQGKLLTLTQK